jgi:hypothetical protein
MRIRGSRLWGAVLAVLVLGSCSGCGASVSTGASTGSSRAAAQSTGSRAAQIDTGMTPSELAAATSHPQRPGTCKIAPPEFHFPTGEWTATKTIVTTEDIDDCAGEQLVRPWDFRRVCEGGRCGTYLLTESYYGVDVARVEPDGPDRYLAVFRPSTVPCPHRLGEDIKTNQDYTTLTLRLSADGQSLSGQGREHQVGPCGSRFVETADYVATRTNPAARPPAEGP